MNPAGKMRTKRDTGISSATKEADLHTVMVKLTIKYQNKARSYFLRIDCALVSFVQKQKISKN